MAETKTTAKTTAKDATKPYVALRNAESAAGSFNHGEVVYLHDNEVIRGLVDGGYLQPQDEYLAQTDGAVLAQMERETGVSARESGSQPGE